MRSDAKAPRTLVVAAGLVLAFLHFPMFIIGLYAFSPDEKSFQFPPDALTTRWFAVALEREDVWQAISLSLRSASAATLLAVLIGTAAAFAMHRSRWFGRETFSLLLVLPLALPGIVTGIALRSAFGTAGLEFTFWTIVVGHATFCVAVVFNNVLARLRRIMPSQIEASMDLGANAFQTFARVVMPHVGTALVAGAMLAFALSFDEIIVTTFVAGQQTTLPIWMMAELIRPRQRPVTNVVALLIIVITFIPIILADKLTRAGQEIGGAGK